MVTMMMIVEVEIVLTPPKLLLKAINVIKKTTIFGNKKQSVDIYLIDTYIHWMTKIDGIGAMSPNKDGPLGRALNKQDKNSGKFFLNEHTAKLNNNYAYIMHYLLP